MNNLILKSISIGVISAALFLSQMVLGGFGMLFYFLTPLPILWLGLTTSPLLAFFSAALTGLLINLSAGSAFSLLLSLQFTFPAALLSYIALKAKEERVGNIVFATSLIALSMLIGILAFRFGFNFESYQTQMKAFITRFLENTKLQSPALQGADKANMIEFLAGLIPVVSMVIWCETMLINLYLAAKLAVKTQKIASYPNLHTMKLPMIAFWLAGLASLLSFLGGAIGFIGLVSLACFGFAFTMQGLSVMHFMTLNKPWRGAFLIGFYLASLTGWPLIFIFFVGLADIHFNLRKI